MWLAGVGLTFSVVSFAQVPFGSVRVNVRVQETSEPLAGAQVTLRVVNVQDNLPSGLLDLPDNEADLLTYLQALAASRGIQVPLPTAVTDASGNAVFSSVVAGRYSVDARRDGYVGVRSNGVPTVDVAPSQSTSVSLDLNVAASVSGRIRDADGRPVAGAFVALSLVQTQNGRPDLVQTPGGGATTDSNGEYRLSTVTPGEYVIRASTATSFPRLFYPGVVDFEQATRISVKAGQSVTGIDIDVPK
jgi:hypothetical protein